MAPASHNSYNSYNSYKSYNAPASVAMHTADAIKNLDPRRGTLTAGGGGVSESYENYESYESGGAPLNYAAVVSLQKP